MRCSMSGAVALLAIWPLGLVCGGETPAPTPDPAMEALTAFVTTDCEVGDPGLALSRLLEHAQAAQPELIRLLSEGPDEAAAVELRTTAEAAWERRAAFLATNPPLGLAPDDLVRVYGMDREAWIDAQLRHVTQRLRQRAALGLAAIGSPGAVHALREARAGADPALRGVIDSALTRLHAPGTRTRVRPARLAGGPKNSARP